MQRLRKDTSGAMSIGKILEFLAPYVLRAIINLFSNAYGKLRYVPLWTSTYYHIHEPLRKTMHSYIQEGEKENARFTRVGFIFGDQRPINGINSTAVYAFLPLKAVLEKYGGTTIGKKDIENLARTFVKAAKGKISSDYLVKTGKLLLAFIFEIGATGELEGLLLAAEEYKNAYKKLKTREERETFLRATFLGVYASSERFERVALFGRFSDLVAKAQVVGAEGIKQDLEELMKMVQAHQISREVEIVYEEGNKNVGVVHRLFGIFKPPLTKKEEIEQKLKEILKKHKKLETIVGGKIMIPPPLLIVNHKDLEILKKICKFSALNDYMLGQNKARAPIVLDLYKDKGPEINSICAGLDKKEKMIKQIKFLRYFGYANERISSLLKEIGP